MTDVKENVKKISADIRENERYIQERCENCADILIRPMRLGDEHKVDCLMVYIEVAVSNMMLDDSAIGKMINHFWEIPPEKIPEFMQNNSLGIADVQKLNDMNEVFGAILSGNAVFFIDGSSCLCTLFSAIFHSLMLTVVMGISEHGGVGGRVRKSAPWFQRGIFRFGKNKLCACAKKTA